MLRLLAISLLLVASACSLGSDASDGSSPLVSIDAPLPNATVGGQVSIDVTAVDVMDSFSTRILRDLSLMIRLRGAEMVIVGIQPEVAFAMVQLGLTLQGVGTALDLEGGLSFLDRKVERKAEDTGPRGR